MTYYKDGDYNFYCDLCGRKEKASNASRTWDGFFVCKHHLERRNEQDFVRGIKDDQSIPWSRSKPLDTFPNDNFLVKEDGDFITQSDAAYIMLGPLLVPNL